MINCSSFVARHKHWIASLTAGICLMTAAITWYRGTNGTFTPSSWQFEVCMSFLGAAMGYTFILACAYGIEFAQMVRRLSVNAQALLDAAFRVIEMNRQHALDQYGDAEKAEGWACVMVLREAIATATHPVPEPIDPHGSMDVAEESMREFLYDGGTDKADIREQPEAPASDQRARELLARELDARHFPAMAAEIRAGGDNTLAAAMVNVVARSIDLALDLAKAAPVSVEEGSARA